MKFILKETTKVSVGKRQEDSYLYVSEDSTAIVQFNAGKKSWTWDIGLATNEAGHAIAKKVIEAFIRKGQSALADGLGNSDALLAGFYESIRTLEIPS